jgi:hypothetical protein
MKVKNLSLVRKHEKASPQMGGLRASYIKVQNTKDFTRASMWTSKPPVVSTNPISTISESEEFMEESSLAAQFLAPSSSGEMRPSIQPKQIEIRPSVFDHAPPVKGLHKIQTIIPEEEERESTLTQHPSVLPKKSDIAISVTEPQKTEIELFQRESSAVIPKQEQILVSEEVKEKEKEKPMIIESGENYEEAIREGGMLFIASNEFHKSPHFKSINQQELKSLQEWKKIPNVDMQEKEKVLEQMGSFGQTMLTIGEAFVVGDDFLGSETYLTMEDTQQRKIVRARKQFEKAQAWTQQDEEAFEKIAKEEVLTETFAKSTEFSTMTSGYKQKVVRAKAEMEHKKPEEQHFESLEESGTLQAVGKKFILSNEFYSTPDFKQLSSDTKKLILKAKREKQDEFALIGMQEDSGWLKSLAQNYVISDEFAISKSFEELSSDKKQKITRARKIMNEKKQGKKGEEKKDIDFLILEDAGVLEALGEELILSEEFKSTPMFQDLDSRTQEKVLEEKAAREKRGSLMMKQVESGAEVGENTEVKDLREEHDKEKDQLERKLAKEKKKINAYKDMYKKLKNQNSDQANFIHLMKGAGLGIQISLSFFTCL